MASKVVSDGTLQALWAEHKSYKGVARAAGIDRNSVRRRLQRMHIGAPSTDEPLPAPVPEGFHVTQLTTDGDGVPKSIQSKPDVEDPVEAPRLPVLLDGHEVKGVSSYVKNGQVTGQWVKTRVSPYSSRELVEAIDRHMEDYRGEALPEPRVIIPGTDPSYRLNHFVWGDPHIGLLAHARETGNNFDLKIATTDLRRSVDLLVRKAPMAGTAVLCEVGDLWHAENDKQLTPRGGNKLDVDGRKTKIMEQGLACLEYMINRLLQMHHHVVVVIVPGNHDPDLSLITRIWLAAIYRGSDRVEVLDNTNPYMYLRWNRNLFMYTHGDKRVKPQELGEIMLVDRPQDIGECPHRRAFTGHIHHKNVQEFRWGRWESFNSLCAPDFWHHSEGYRSERLVECITFHERFGEESRCRVTHQEIREAA